MDSRTVDRVQKLLALARNNPNSNEAAVAFARAQEIATRAGLDIEDVPLDEGFEEAPAPELEDDVDEVVIESGKLVHWKLDLTLAIARANGCDGYYLSATRERKLRSGTVLFPATKATIRIYGQPRDVATAKYLALAMISTVDEMATAAILAYKSRPDLDPRFDASPRAYGSAWRTGCVDAISARMKPRETILEERRAEIDEARRAAIAGDGDLATPTGALVRVARAEERMARAAEILEQTRERLGLGTGAASRAGRGSTAGYADGRAAGRRMNIGGDARALAGGRHA